MPENTKNCILIPLTTVLFSYDHDFFGLGEKIPMMLNSLKEENYLEMAAFSSACASHLVI